MEKKGKNSTLKRTIKIYFSFLTTNLEETRSVKKKGRGKGKKKES